METKQRIAEAARKIYISEGYQALSMRKIARSAKVSPMAAYRHFENKDALVIYLLKQGFELFEHYLLKSLDKEQSEGQLIESGRQYFLFAVEHPHYYKLMFVDQEFASLTLDLKTQAQFNRTFQFLIDRVKACMYDKVLQDEDPEAVAAHIWAHVHGLTSLFLAQKMPMNQVEYTNFYVTSLAWLINGLK